MQGGKFSKGFERVRQREGELQGTVQRVKDKRKSIVHH